MWNQSFDVQTLQNRLKRLYSRNREETTSPYDKMITTISDSHYRIQKDSLGRTAYIPPKATYRAKKFLNFVNRIDTFTVIDGVNWMD